MYWRKVSVSEVGDILCQVTNVSTPGQDCSAQCHESPPCLSVILQIIFLWSSSVSSAHRPALSLSLSDHRPHRVSWVWSKDSSCKWSPTTAGDWFGSFPSVTEDTLHSEAAKWAWTSAAQTYHHRWQQRGYGVSLHHTHTYKLSWFLWPKTCKSIKQDLSWHGCMTFSFQTGLSTQIILKKFKEII